MKPVVPSNSSVPQERYKQAGEQVKSTNLQLMKDQLALFKAKLEEFAHKHRNDIRKDPVFRAQFQTMCANIGVDPLASNKGAWAVLGIGDFYYELGVQIIEACWATRAHNGGLMELGALLRFVQKRRGGMAEAVTEDDVVRALRKLKALGEGFDLVAVGRAQYVRSVPGELNMDKNKLLELAQDKGYVSKQDVMSRAGWTATRAEDVLQAMLKEGLAMVDDGAPDRVRLFWFPAVASSGH